MGLTVVQGPAGNVMQETEVYGAQSSRTGATKMHSQKVINFRVGRTPLMMKLKATIDIADGDNVSAVGSMKGGVLQGLAVRNDETGVTYAHSWIGLLTWGILATLFGLATLAIVLGVLILPFGLFLIYKALQTKKALGMLNSASPMESVAAT